MHKLRVLPTVGHDKHWKTLKPQGHYSGYLGFQSITAMIGLFMDIRPSNEFSRHEQDRGAFWTVGKWYASIWGQHRARKDSQTRTHLSEWSSELHLSQLASCVQHLFAKSITCSSSNLQNVFVAHHVWLRVLANQQSASSPWARIQPTACKSTEDDHKLRRLHSSRKRP